MFAVHRLALRVAILACASSIAFAAGIEPGLWKITHRTETGGVMGPPMESSKCVTPEQVRDLASTFSPIPQTVNSTCAPMERNFDGQKLTWHLVCKGQIDMELTGEFTFDNPRHYSGTVHSKAAMIGQPMLDSKEIIDGQWVSECK